jgi:hypothetical protein
MTVTYIKQVRDDLGEIIDEQNADSEIRWMNREIYMLKAALEIQMQTVADLRELLDGARRIACELNDKLLKGEG